MHQGTGEASYAAFLAAPLPPIPPILVDSALQRQIEAAGLALGRLDGLQASPNRGLSGITTKFTGRRTTIDVKRACYCRSGATPC